MKRVLKGIGISMLVVFVMMFELIALAYTSRVVSYLNRGFSGKDALEWTSRDFNMDDTTEKEEEQDWYPMANANISWNSLGREP